MKLIYIDVETSGLEPTVNGLVEIGIIYEDTKLVLPINTFTYNRDVKIDKEALEINGKTRRDIRSYPKSDVQFKKFISFLDGIVNKYDKKDKLKIVGYNVRFDIDFIKNWFLDNDHKFYGSYFDHKYLCVFELVKHLNYVQKWDIENEKLPTLAEYFDIPHSPHDALSDIEATKTLMELLHKRIER